MLSTTARMTRNLEIELPRYQPTILKDISIDELDKQFSLLKKRLQNTQLSEQERQAIEDNKLDIIELIRQSLLKYTNSKKNQSLVKAERSSFTKKLGAKVLSGCLVLLSGINGFLGGCGLLSLLPFTTNIPLLACGALLGLINSVLFYSFESGILKKSLGIQSLDQAAHTLLNTHEMQISAVKEINHLLFDVNIVNKIKYDNYRQICNITKKFNQHIDDKKKLFSIYKEKPAVTVLRNGVNGFGLLMAAGNGYFLMHSLLLATAVSLLATPVGWGLIGLAVVSSLSLFLFIRSRGMFGMVNPMFAQFERIQTKLNQFNVKSEDDFTEAVSNKARLIMPSSTVNVEPVRLVQRLVVEEEDHKMQQTPACK